MTSEECPHPRDKRDKYPHRKADDSKTTLESCRSCGMEWEK